MYSDTDAFHRAKQGQNPFFLPEMHIDVRDRSLKQIVLLELCQPDSLSLKTDLKTTFSILSLVEVQL